MTRVYAKGEKPATNATSSAIPPSANMSSTQPPSSAAPSRLPVSLSAMSITDELQDSKEVEQDVPVHAESPDPSPPASSRLPEDSIKTNTVPTPLPSDESLKVPHLANKARLRIHFEDLSNPAVAKFLTTMPVSNLLQTAISNVQKHLFTPPGKHHYISEHSPPPPPPPPQTTPNPTAACFIPQPNATSSAIPIPVPTRPPPPQTPIPNPSKPWFPQEVRAVTLIIRPMDGVAYTTGTILDPSHKEIHLNTGYIDNIRNSNSSKPDGDSLFTYELNGVVTHEMVHVFQHDAHSSCPGGLIEGIADYVRLKSGLGAKHWNPWPADKKSRGEKWDEGYQKTAWFLGWVESEVGEGCIGWLNFEMRKRRWDDGKVWRDVMGEEVGEMWKRYEGSWEGMNRKHEKKEEEEKEREGGSENCEKGV